LKIRTENNSEEDVTLNKLKEEISLSQLNLKSLREQLEKLIVNAENYKPEGESFNLLKEQIKSIRDNLIKESSKIKNNKRKNKK